MVKDKGSAEEYIFLLMPAISLGLLLAFLFSCAREVSPAKSSQVATVKSAEPAPGGPAWQQEWDRIEAEARKEGRLVIHIGAGIAPTLRQEIAKIMKSRYGLELEMIAGRATELAEKVIREQRAGLYLADLYISGATTALIRIKPAGAFDPLEPVFLLPEVKDPGMWLQGIMPFTDKEKMIFSFSAYPSSGLEYNADHVSKEDLQSYRDLLNPKWKGKIVWSDPSIGGSGNMWFSTIGLRVMGQPYLRDLARQDIAFTRDLRQMAEWMARGKYPLGVGAGGSLVEMQKAGVPLVSFTPKEGSYLTSGWGNIALYKKAPHSSAARLFINWFLSKEGQTIYARGMDAQSARIDAPTDFLTPVGVRQPNMSYFDTRGEKFQLEKEQEMQIAREIFNLR